MKKLICITLLMAMLFNIVTVFPAAQEDYTVTDKSFYIGKDITYQLVAGNISGYASIKNNTNAPLSAVIALYLIAEQELIDIILTPVTIPVGETVKKTTLPLTIPSEYVSIGELKMSIWADAKDIQPLCRTSYISSTTTTPEPLTEIYDDFSGLTLTESGVDIKYAVSGNKYYTANGLYLETGTNPSALHKNDDVKQDSFVRGNGWSDKNLDTHLIYRGNFDGQMVRVETALNGSASYSLEEYIKNYGLYLQVSTDGVYWRNIAFTDHEYTNSVKYYHVNSTDGDRICTYYADPLPDDTKYVKIGFVGDWFKKIFNVKITSNKNELYPTTTPSPTPTPTVVPTPTPTPLAVTELYDDFSELTFDSGESLISNATSGKKFKSATGLYHKYQDNPVALHRGDNTKQTTFVEGNGWSDSSASNYITYTGVFDGLLLRVETSTVNSANFTLNEYISNYGLEIETSSNGRLWKDVEITSYDYSNYVLYYGVNNANGDKICSYTVETLPANSRYIRISFKGDWGKKIFNVMFTSDKTGATPPPVPTATPNPTAVPKEELFDDYSTVKYSDSSNIALNKNTDNNIVAVNKSDGTAQNTYASGNKNSGDYDTSVIYEGDFGGQLLGIETSLKDSADLTLKEYVDAYGLQLYISEDGETWIPITPQGYIYDEYVRYYLYDYANGDKICTYIVNALPEGTKYVKYGFTGDWKNKIFYTVITSDKEYYKNKNVCSSLYDAGEGMYSYTLTDTMAGDTTLWSTSGQVWLGVNERITYPTNPWIGKECIIARRDNTRAESQVVYALVSSDVDNIEIESFYFNSGVDLDTMLEDTGLRFYESPNNKDYTEINDISLTKEPSTKYQQMHSRVVYNITGIKKTSKYFKIVFPSVEHESLWPWSAKLSEVKVTYFAEDDSSGHDFSKYDARKYTSHKVSVIAPEYTSDITGNPEIVFCAPGMTSVTARCWKQSDDGLGNDSVVATVKLDENGFGSFIFPAEEYPHGPIIVRLMGYGGTHLDECHLQLYNKGGVSWMEGTAAYDDPPQAIAAGLELVYEDDFNTKPTISWNGKGTTYTSHKPSWGDFSGIAFTNDEIWDTGKPNPISPYSQVDTYLRIRADEKKNSTGLLCSVGLEHEGFKVSYPCYFECKFIAQNAIGAWPSFWLLTEHPLDTVERNDELDIIEAYGFEKTNIDGHTITRIPWNYPDGSKGEIKFVPTSYIGNGGHWYTNFHTYGCLIEEDYTRYYFDNIELWSHPTQAASKEDPFYFLINYAFGGSSGWPFDLSRYNYVSDMYVDYVRVYGLEENVHYESKYE